MPSTPTGADVLCMSPLQAARLSAEDYIHGEVQGMALMLGKSHETLRKELAGAPGYKLGLMDAIRIMTRSGDFRIADAIEAELGRYAMPLPEAIPRPGDHRQLADHLVCLSKEFGDVLQEAAARAADFDVSDNDVRAIAKQWGELVAAGNAFMRFVIASNRDCKPRGESQ